MGELLSLPPAAALVVRLGSLAVTRLTGEPSGLATALLLMLVLMVIMWLGTKSPMVFCTSRGSAPSPLELLCRSPNVRREWWLVAVLMKDCVDMTLWCPCIRVVGRWKLGGEKVAPPGACACACVWTLSAEYECWWWPVCIAAGAGAAGIGGGHRRAVSVWANPTALYADAGVRGDWGWLKLLLPRTCPLESRICLCGEEEVGVLLLDAKGNRGPAELVDEPVDMVGVDTVFGDKTAVSAKDVCNGAGRGLGVKLLDRKADENLSWLALRFPRPGRMTSLISASRRSMLSCELSLVMMDISNSFSTWIPSWYSLTLVKPGVPTAVEPVMAVVPVMAVFLLAWRDEMTVTVRALCMGSPPLAMPDP